MAQFEMREIRTKQREDPAIYKWRRASIVKRPPSRIIGKEDRIMRKSFAQLIVKRGILFRKLELHGDTLEQLLFPKCYRQYILQGLHSDAGHQGQEQILKLMSELFSGLAWRLRCMSTPVTNASDARVEQTAEHLWWMPIPLSHLGWCFDFLTLEVSKGGFVNVWVITDNHICSGCSQPKSDCYDDNGSLLQWMYCS